MNRSRITIAGAGSIGCFVGGLLVHQGFDVRFLARPSMIEAVRKQGLRLSDFGGLDLHVPEILAFEDEEQALDGADLVLVCVKAGDTEKMGRVINTYARSAQVISLQNGVGNASTLRDVLPGADVRGGMVPFNVVSSASGQYHRATSGDILVEQGPLPELSGTHATWRSVNNIEAVQWGKLLINLGNAVNALADMPLLDQLNDRKWRLLMADQMIEALRVLRAANISPAKTSAVPPGLIPHILRLPTSLFRVVASQMLTIDRQARSSMWDDLQHGRKTEIEALQGAILQLAERFGRQAPLNARMRVLIRTAEAAADGPPGLGVEQVRGQKS
ncbi:2-dehydropantoate 2-reductase [Tateyamaria sp.]|uniref:2-dehydropantoate 2-reductase n=1 Tax=Tateyamaria sp. TaxID=1929288 RepID=UPI00329E4643